MKSIAFNVTYLEYLSLKFSFNSLGSDYLLVQIEIWWRKEVCRDWAFHGQTNFF